MRGTTTTRLAALGTTVVLLAGCNGGSDPGATPSGTNGSGPASSSTTSAATSTGTATTPSGTATVTIPAAARAHTLDGAKAFAAYFVDAMNDSQVRADSTTLSAISGPNCKGCKAYI
ncbi:MAG TPA: DUF6318 family protein, partial [Pedococcus sp.]